MDGKGHRHRQVVLRQLPASLLHDIRINQKNDPLLRKVILRNGSDAFISQRFGLFPIDSLNPKLDQNEGMPSDYSVLDASSKCIYEHQYRREEYGNRTMALSESIINGNKCNLMQDSLDNHFYSNEKIDGKSDASFMVWFLRRGSMRLCIPRVPDLLGKIIAHFVSLICKNIPQNEKFRNKIYNKPTKSGKRNIGFTCKCSNTNSATLSRHNGGEKRINKRSKVLNRSSNEKFDQMLNESTFGKATCCPHFCVEDLQRCLTLCCYWPCMTDDIIRFILNPLNHLCPCFEDTKMPSTSFISAQAAHSIMECNEVTNVVPSRSSYKQNEFTDKDSNNDSDVPIKGPKYKVAGDENSSCRTGSNILQNIPQNSEVSYVESDRFMANRRNLENMELPCLQECIPENGSKCNDIEGDFVEMKVWILRSTQKLFFQQPELCIAPFSLIPIRCGGDVLLLEQVNGGAGIGESTATASVFEEQCLGENISQVSACGGKFINGVPVSDSCAETSALSHVLTEDFNLPDSCGEYPVEWKLAQVDNRYGNAVDAGGFNQNHVEFTLDANENNLNSCLLGDSCEWNILNSLLRTDPSRFGMSTYTVNHDSDGEKECVVGLSPDLRFSQGTGNIWKSNSSHLIGSSYPATVFGGSNRIQAAQYSSFVPDSASGTYHSISNDEELSAWSTNEGIFVGCEDVEQDFIERLSNFLPSVGSAEPLPLFLSSKSLRAHCEAHEYVLEKQNLPSPCLDGESKASTLVWLRSSESLGLLPKDLANMVGSLAGNPTISNNFTSNNYANPLDRIDMGRRRRRSLCTVTDQSFATVSQSRQVTIARCGTYARRVCCFLVDEQFLLQSIHTLSRSVWLSCIYTGCTALCVAIRIHIDGVGLVSGVRCFYAAEVPRLYKLLQLWIQLLVDEQRSIFNPSQTGVSVAFGKNEDAAGCFKENMESTRINANKQDREALKCRNTQLPHARGDSGASRSVSVSTECLEVTGIRKSRVSKAIGTRSSRGLTWVSYLLNKIDCMSAACGMSALDDAGLLVFVLLELLPPLRSIVALERISRYHGSKADNNLRCGGCMVFKHSCEQANACAGINENHADTNKTSVIRSRSKWRLHALPQIVPAAAVAAEVQGDYGDYSIDIELSAHGFLGLQGCSRKRFSSPLSHEPKNSAPLLALMDRQDGFYESRDAYHMASTILAPPEPIEPPERISPNFCPLRDRVLYGIRRRPYVKSKILTSVVSNALLCYKVAAAMAAATAFRRNEACRRNNCGLYTRSEPNVPGDNSNCPDRNREDKSVQSEKYFRFCTQKQQDDTGRIIRRLLVRALSGLEKANSGNEKDLWYDGEPRQDVPKNHVLRCLTESEILTAASAYEYLADTFMEEYADGERSVRKGYSDTRPFCKRKQRVFLLNKIGQLLTRGIQMLACVPPAILSPKNLQGKNGGSKSTTQRTTSIRQQLRNGWIHRLQYRLQTKLLRCHLAIGICILPTAVLPLAALTESGTYGFFQSFFSREITKHIGPVNMGIKKRCCCARSFNSESNTCVSNSSEPKVSFFSQPAVTTSSETVTQSDDKGIRCKRALKHVLLASMLVPYASGKKYSYAASRTDKLSNNDGQSNSSCENNVEKHGRLVRPLICALIAEALYNCALLRLSKGRHDEVFGISPKSHGNKAMDEIQRHPLSAFLQHLPPWCALLLAIKFGDENLGWKRREDSEVKSSLNKHLHRTQATVDDSYTNTNVPWLSGEPWLAFSPDPSEGDPEQQLTNSLSFCVRGLGELASIGLIYAPVPHNKHRQKKYGHTGVRSYRAGSSANHHSENDNWGVIASMPVGLKTWEIDSCDMLSYLDTVYQFGAANHTNGSRYHTEFVDKKPKHVNLQQQLSESVMEAARELDKRIKWIFGAIYVALGCNYSRKGRMTRAVSCCRSGLEMLLLANDKTGGALVNACLCCLKLQPLLQSAQTSSRCMRNYDSEACGRKVAESLQQGPKLALTDVAGMGVTMDPFQAAVALVFSAYAGEPLRDNDVQLLLEVKRRLQDNLAVTYTLDLYSYLPDKDTDNLEDELPRGKKKGACGVFRTPVPRSPGCSNEDALFMHQRIRCLSGAISFRLVVYQLYAAVDAVAATSALSGYGFSNKANSNRSERLRVKNNSKTMNCVSNDHACLFACESPSENQIHIPSSEIPRGLPFLPTPLLELWQESVKPLNFVGSNHIPHVHNENVIRGDKGEIMKNSGKDFVNEDKTCFVDARQSYCMNKSAPDIILALENCRSSLKELSDFVNNGFSDYDKLPCGSMCSKEHLGQPDGKYSLAESLMQVINLLSKCCHASFLALVGVARRKWRLALQKGLRVGGSRGKLPQNILFSSADWRSIMQLALTEISNTQSQIALHLEVILREIKYISFRLTNKKFSEESLTPHVEGQFDSDGMRSSCCNCMTGPGTNGLKQDFRYKEYNARSVDRSDKGVGVCTSTYNADDRQYASSEVVDCRGQVLVLLCWIMQEGLVGSCGLQLCLGTNRLWCRDKQQAKRRDVEDNDCETSLDSVKADNNLKMAKQCAREILSALKGRDSIRGTQMRNIIADREQYINRKISCIPLDSLWPTTLRKGFSKNIPAQAFITSDNIKWHLYIGIHMRTDSVVDLPRRSCWWLEKAMCTLLQCLGEVEF